MRRNGAIETGRDRSELARDAGFGRFSVLSVLAGTLAAYGTFALLLPLVTAVARALGVDEGISTNDWRRLGTGAGVAVALTLFPAYLFGGYTAGRMARRQGLLHGLFVFLASILAATAVGALVGALTDLDGDQLLANLRNLGVPTATDEWRRVATVAGLASLGAMFLGSLLGGWRGEGWHGRLLRRALDPDVGLESRMRRLAAEAEGRHASAEDRVRRTRGRIDGPSAPQDTVVIDRPPLERREQVVVTRESLEGGGAHPTIEFTSDQLLGGDEAGSTSPGPGRRGGA